MMTLQTVRDLTGEFTSLSTAAAVAVHNNAKIKVGIDGKWEATRESNEPWQTTLSKVNTLLSELGVSEEDPLQPSQLVPFKKNMEVLHETNTKNLFGKLFTRETNDDKEKYQAWGLFQTTITMHEIRAPKIDKERAASAMYDLMNHNNEEEFKRYFNSLNATDNPSDKRTLNDIISNLKEMRPDVAWLDQFMPKTASTKNVTKSVEEGSL